jgi:hypothetical protein
METQAEKLSVEKISIKGWKSAEADIYILP